MKEEKISEAFAYSKYFEKIFTTENAQTSIRDRVKAASTDWDGWVNIYYTPVSGRNKGKKTRVSFDGKTKRLISYLYNVSEKDDEGNVVKLDKIGTLWDDLSWSSVSSEGGVPYPNGKKPIKLILRLLEMTISEENQLVVDFFAGSGTLAHACLDFNKKIRSVSVQLPEMISLQDKNEIYSGLGIGNLNTIADISKERIRRAASKIHENLELSIAQEKRELIKLNTEVAKFPDDLLFTLDRKEEYEEAQRKVTAQEELIREKELLLEKLDLGFRVFKLQKSNFSVWDSSFTTDAEQIAFQLDQHVDHISPEAEQQAILFELLLKAGFELTTPIDTLTLADKTVYSIAEGALLICLEKQLTLEVMHAIADLEPSRVIVLDEGFQNNDQLKTNASLTLKSKGILDFRTV